MTQSKSWYQSRTIWGSLIAIAASLSGALGFTLTASDQTLILDAVLQFVSIVGAALALFGRLKAEQKIG